MHRFCHSTSVPTDETTDSEIPEDQEDVLGSGPTRHQGCELALDPGNPQMEHLHETWYSEYPCVAAHKNTASTGV